MYATSPFALVQLASQGGAVQWIGYDQDARRGTSWQALTSLSKASASASGPGSGPSADGNATTSGKPASGSSSGNSTNTNTDSEDDGSAVSVGSQATLVLGVVVGSLVGLVGLAF